MPVRVGSATCRSLAGAVRIGSGFQKGATHRDNDRTRLVRRGVLVGGVDTAAAAGLCLDRDMA